MNLDNLGKTITLDITVLIPALNEAKTIAGVVLVAQKAGFQNILVVSDGSTDETVKIAKDAGASVLELQPNRGKGGAVKAGALTAITPYLLLLDADLLNLEVQHLHAMLEPVLQKKADTTAGLFVGGGIITDFGNRATPQWSGQRVIPRATILAAKNLETAGYGIEIAINDQIAVEHLRLEYIDLVGVSQVIKEKKLGLVAGIARRIKMYWQILRYSTSKRH
jgi:glycosyltransferase involved in cell wall biosynthesis